MAKNKDKPEKKYRKLNFCISQLEGCCGIGVISGFSEAPPYEYNYTGWRVTQNRVKAKFHTEEEQAQDAYDRLIRDTWWSTRKNGDYYEDFSFLMISLVSDYNVPNPKHPTGVQFPALQDILIREDWQINQVFINPNHGNEVTLFTKYFPERNKLEDDEHYNDDPEEDDDY